MTSRFISIEELERAFHRARCDLADVGLLEPGKYLDHVECVLSPLPSGYWEELGYVFDGGVSGLHRFVGYEPGTIYIPANPPVSAYMPGSTLLDTVRHEFAHAWAWYDLPYVDGSWFRETFGGRYHDEWPEGEEPEWAERSFVSEYACTRPKEDFAETFMFYLKYRRSLGRFRSRPKLYEKLRAVGAAAREAARTRTSRRGPRA